MRELRSIKSSFCYFKAFIKKKSYKKTKNDKKFDFKDFFCS